MSRTSLKHMQCSLARTADILGDQWMLLILRDAFYGVKSFSDLRRNLGVAANVLSVRLEKLVDEGILAREPVRPGVERYHYHLTEKGKALFPVLISMTQWGDKWIFGNEGEPVQFIDREQRAPLQTVAVQARDGRCLQPADVTFRPGPSAHPRLMEIYGTPATRDAEG